MKKIIESNLEFVFQDKWEVLQYDKSSEYRSVNKMLSGTKAIDFACFYKKKSLVLFEIKNFRGYGHVFANQQKLSHGMDALTTEIAQKVRDSIAVISGIGHNDNSNQTVWSKMLHHLCNKKHVMVVAWIEEDVNKVSLRKRKKNEMSVRSEKLKKKLSWLTKYVFIENVKEQHFSFEGLSVRPATCGS